MIVLVYVQDCVCEYLLWARNTLHRSYHHLIYLLLVLSFISAKQDEEEQNEKEDEREREIRREG